MAQLHRTAFSFSGALAGCLLLIGSLGCSRTHPTTHINTEESPMISESHTIIIRAAVPENAGSVYLPGNLPELGPWDPGKYLMQGEGRERIATLTVPHGHELEFKLTQGAWSREGVGPSGTMLPNFKVLADADREYIVEIYDFKKDNIGDYLADPKRGGVLGELTYWLDVPSKNLANTRHVSIWLPPGYTENPDSRYPVLYMHDGQNLFDPRIANTGVDWGVDETIVKGMEAGTIPPMIVVGIWNGNDRRAEYSPWHKGPNYAKFLIEELMPRVNAEYRTLTGPGHTAVMGSSMGGLISFWLAWKHPEVFGMAGCLSTHFVWDGVLGAGGPPLILPELTPQAKYPKSVRVYFDYGTVGIDAPYEPIQMQVNKWLADQGFKEGDHFVSRKFEGATHNEAAWRERLDSPFKFLFGPMVK